MCRETGRLILIACVVIAGCRRGPRIPRNDDIPPATRSVIETPIAAPVEHAPVKRGRLPLFYLMEFPGELMIVDATTAKILVQTRAGGRTIVSVTADGVEIGSKPMASGPLDPTHEFEIFLTNPSENVGRSIYERR